MHGANTNEVPQIYMHAGDVKVSSDPCVFITVLGSCISVCLYDLVHCYGGMNHFMHVGIDPVNQKNTRWSQPALHQLIAKMKRLGSDPRELVAKVIGGANVMRAITTKVGDHNAFSAYIELEKWGIPVLEADIGGTASRKLCFNSYTGEIELR